MRVDAAIIGGTGIGDRLTALGGESMHVPTQAGMLRGKVIELRGRTVLLLKRHSAGHKVPPHMVNYRAMALGLAALGVPVCFATAAVGSLREDWGGGTMAVCHDFLDLSFRNPTLFDRTVVHTDFTNPFGPIARKALLSGGGDDLKDKAVYVCGNGPRYETPHEIQMYRQLGGDVVGMTAATEAVLFRESGIAYGCLAVVTNFACGISPTPLTHEEVVEEMERSGQKAVDILASAVASL